jgi:ABC-type uncharacterized transport system substrate-binding protein
MKYITRFLILLVLNILICNLVAFTEDTAPSPRVDGKAWRVGYYEGGYYNDYIPVTKAIIARLTERGWMAKPNQKCLKNAEKSNDIWICLQDSQGPYLEFVSDAYWSANWNNEKRSQNKQTYLKRASKGDLDLILALGTWAGQDLANKSHTIPTIVCSTSNPLSAGIIKSAEDSGFDHIHARYDPYRYRRQVQLFHEVVGFKKLGVVFENSQEGRSYAALDQLEPIAKVRGFDLKTCNAPFSGVKIEVSQAAVLACHKQLAPKVDAFYITTHRGVSRTSISALLKPFFKYKVPTFAMGTLYEVDAGAMMSMAQANFKYAGDFYADVAIRILKGEKARSINQVFPDPQEVRINLKTAELIGFHFPIEVMTDADDILETIEVFEE